MTSNRIDTDGEADVLTRCDEDPRNGMPHPNFCVCDQRLKVGDAYIDPVSRCPRGRLWNSPCDLTLDGAPFGQSSRSAAYCSEEWWELYSGAIKGEGGGFMYKVDRMHNACGNEGGAHICFACMTNRGQCFLQNPLCVSIQWK